MRAKLQKGGTLGRKAGRFIHAGTAEEEELSRSLRYLRQCTCVCIGPKGSHAPRKRYRNLGQGPSKREREREGGIEKEMVKRQRQNDSSRRDFIVGVDEWQAVSHDHAKVIWVIWVGERSHCLTVDFIMALLTARARSARQYASPVPRLENKTGSDSRLHQR